MKIHEVEQLVGITKKNIRFYEQEGLLAPPRNRENGYRDYGEQELRALYQIKLLRKLGLPLEEIRKLQGGSLTVQDAVERHRVLLERQRKSLEQSRMLCEELSELTGPLRELDPLPWLERMTQMEQEGVNFMNRQRNDRKPRLMAPVIAAGVMIFLMVALMALMGWCTLLEEDPMPVWLMVVFDLPCLAVIVGVLLALRQRIRELQSDELHQASRY